ncbi:unnamed protein product [Diatraea saccharalis]|uniref:Uncharacterized protein n=1 Tax=Diatraea saccharalis TaxID=40085 RepID=A0A9P0G360_9NEOP|nr:unnamed protein product [Diatraea saccharalis]
MSKVIIDIDEKQYSYEYFLDEKVCRFCWNKEAERDIIALIPNKSCNNQFVDKIKDCLGINLNENSFPKKACNSCYYKIEEYYEFKYFCQKTDKRLSELTKLNTNKFILHCNVKTESVDSYECDNNKNGDILDISQNVKDERDCEISQNNIKTDYSELNESKILISDVSIDFEIDEDGNDNELAETAKQKKDKNKKLSYLKSLDIQSSCYRQCFQKGSSKKEVLLKFKNKRYKPKRSPTYCNICCLDLETKEQLAVHNATHHGIEGGNLFKCFGCEKRFKTRKARLAHEVNFCKGLKEGYKCIKCDRFLPKRSMYEAHMRDHREHLEVELPENIFQCAKCYKLFKTKLCLTEHMAEHEALKKNYVCESCGRVFTRQDYLHKHRLTHTGTKQHACPHCGYRTAQRSSLTVHIRYLEDKDKQPFAHTSINIFISLKQH